MKQVDVSLPWGKVAVHAAIKDSAEAQIVLLQQSIIDGQNKDLAAVNTKLDVTQRRCIQLDTDKVTVERKVKELESELASLNERLHELEQQDTAPSSELERLEVRVLELEAELELANKTKDEVLERNYDQERQLEAARYQKETTQRLFDEQRLSFAKHKTEADALRAEVENLTAENGDAIKHIKRIEAELMGVGERIANAVAAERARCEEAHEKETLELKAQLKTAQQTKGDEGKARSLLNEKIQQLESEVQAQRDLAVAAGNLAIAANEEREALKVVAAQEAQVRDGVIEDHAKLTLELEQMKRENLYLSGVLEYQELKTVWKHEDGTVVYIIGMNPEGAVAYSNGVEERPSPNHPICWVMNENGTGHIIMLSEDASELYYPSAAEETEFMLPAEHRSAVLAAMQAVTIAEFEKALDRSVKRHQNVSNSAELLDFDWGVVLNSDRMVRKLMTSPERVAALTEVKNAAVRVKTRAGEYNGQLRSVIKRQRTALKPKAKKKKR